MMHSTFHFIKQIYSIQPEDPYLVQEKQEGIRLILLGMLCVSLLIGFIILQAQYLTAYTLFGLAAVCVVSLLIQRFTGSYRLAALTLIVAAVVVIQYNMMYGQGIQDVAVAALPGLIILSAILFGTPSIPIFTLMTVISALVATLLPHQTISAGDEDWTDFLILTALLIGYAALAHILVSRLEKYLEQLRFKEGEISRAYDATLTGLSKALELRDRPTEGHSRKVVELTERLAREIGINDKHELEVLRYGAMLHDIGKLSIPDSILQKPGPLNEEEWKVMRKHPEYGMALLNEIGYLKRSVDMVLYHHERWDGSGYPKGLRGEAIPMPARLLCIIDNWEALSVDRPYRSRWPQEKIRAYLEQNAGKLFDPQIVSAFLKVVCDQKPCAGSEASPLVSG